MAPTPRNLRLTIRAPGSLLSRVMEVDITEEQAQLIALLLNGEEGFVLVPREFLKQVVPTRNPVGFQPPRRM